MVMMTVMMMMMMMLMVTYIRAEWNNTMWTSPWLYNFSPGYTTITWFIQLIANQNTLCTHMRLTAKLPNKFSTGVCGRA